MCTYLDIKRAPAFVRKTLLSTLHSENPTPFFARILKRKPSPASNSFNVASRKVSENTSKINTSNRTAWIVVVIAFHHIKENNACLYLERVPKNSQQWSKACRSIYWSRTNSYARNTSHILTIKSITYLQCKQFSQNPCRDHPQLVCNCTWTMSW